MVLGKFLRLFPTVGAPVAIGSLDRFPFGEGQSGRKGSFEGRASPHLNTRLLGMLRMVFRALRFYPCRMESNVLCISSSRHFPMRCACVLELLSMAGLIFGITHSAFLRVAGHPCCDPRLCLLRVIQIALFAPSYHLISVSHIPGPFLSLLSRRIFIRHKETVLWRLHHPTE